jgi:hypothetical protein
MKNSHHIVVYIYFCPFAGKKEVENGMPWTFF